MSREKNKPMTNDQRAAVARGWTSSRMDQASYAQLHGIKPRTLREWVLRWAPTVPADVRALAIIDRAIRDLHELRDAVAADVACLQAEQHQEPEQKEAPSTQLPTEPARRPALPGHAGFVMAAAHPGRGCFQW